MSDDLRNERGFVYLTTLHNVLDYTVSRTVLSVSSLYYRNYMDVDNKNYWIYKNARYRQEYRADMNNPNTKHRHERGGNNYRHEHSGNNNSK
jgi:uncharacterized HAD superfamily protein